jgi:uncharacterized membrane protein YwaF
MHFGGWLWYILFVILILLIVFLIWYRKKQSPQ